MKNFEELSSLWITQPQAEQVPVDILLKQVKKGTSALNRKLLWSILIMAATFILMIVLFLFFLFNSWLTYAGIFIIMSTILIYAILMFRDYKLLASHDPTTEVNVYLEKLKLYQTSRTRMYGKMYYVYTILLSVGLGMFLVEVLKPASLFFEITAYTFFLGWILFVTFYWRERIIKTEQEKISEIINRLERLKGQFRD
ncbi:hypothetical protein [Mucilaginibacter arboris]|uniref:Uncharacterized protein n=1 Tax=Mucilaginibacter arboris TaxID=2682090 RepID=A0A7K1SX89_9SPHI|nr:hypothetical protein [Mucilaginibacter arboris]MVN21913.1 hypothetical protein [Mucilaginibacter arboris]